MPELPEVQTVVSQLEQKIVGKQIRKVWSDWKKRILPSFPVFVKQTKDARVLGTRRFGKHIIIDLDNEYSLVIHLKMTGHLLVKSEVNRTSKAFTADPMNGYIHHILTFADDTTLEFSDMRKFGWLRAVKTKDVETLSSIVSLGRDALSLKFTAGYLQNLLSGKKKKMIGVVLLEQDVIAGIGNIYRSEALFLAGVLPTRFIETLSKDEWSAVVVSVKKVLRQALKLGGMSEGDFRDTAGLEGRFQRTLFVYSRDGAPCKKCGTIVVRKKIGQRSVFYCPQCQH